MRLLHPHDAGIHLVEARRSSLLIPRTILSSDGLGPGI